MCPDEKYRKPKDAEALADGALLIAPDSSYAKAAKACALAAAGDFDNAIRLQSEALVDKYYRNDDTIIGGSNAEERIKTWKQKQQWSLQPWTKKMTGDATHF